MSKIITQSIKSTAVVHAVFNKRQILFAINNIEGGTAQFDTDFSYISSTFVFSSTAIIPVVRVRNGTYKRAFFLEKVYKALQRKVEYVVCRQAHHIVIHIIAINGQQQILNDSKACLVSLCPVF